MGRVVATFAAFAVVYPLLALAMRGAFGTAGALTVAGVTIAATLAFGVPAFVVLCRHGWLGWWQCACGGAGVGLLCALPFFFFGSALVGALVPTFVVLGAIHGALFWVFAVWRNARLRERCAGLAH